MEVTGKILEYEHENGERYRILFGLKNITWECLAGPAFGASGTDPYDAVEITPNILFISWSVDEDTVVSIVADLREDILHCCKTQNYTRQFWKGKIKRFAKASINRNTCFQTYGSVELLAAGIKNKKSELSLPQV